MLGHNSDGILNTRLMFIYLFMRTGSCKYARNYFVRAIHSRFRIIPVSWENKYSLRRLGFLFMKYLLILGSDAYVTLIGKKRNVFVYICNV